MLKIKVDFDTLLKEGIKNSKDDFIICLITGYQGSGKSYYAIYNVERSFTDRTIITNIKSYRSGGRGKDFVGGNHSIEYFTKISELYNNHDIGRIFIIDEFSKKYTKDSKIDKDLYSWLQQSRKHKRYVFIITQEYTQVPTWIRGIATLVYSTYKVPLTPFMYTILGKPYLDTDTCEWALNELSIQIYKRNKVYGSLYDTYELINEL